MYPILNVIFLLFFLLSYAVPVFALPEDNKAKVYIAADHTVYNYKTGIKVFEGNVTVDQGSTHLTADRLITKDNEQHQIKEAIAYGLQRPAHYWTLPNVGDPEVHSHALVMKYYPIEGKVVFEKKVIVTQGENSFQGELILYNMNDQIVTVPAAKNGRAVLVYNPDK
ncbi:MAG: lipopolysaccharide transport periplasmic protein LptA [Gammaproteobacteria bacterium]|nr:MAG: lipopolysaccharide transport periplasmic protein LptA [Gammaproteobacteria bacterium]